MSRTHALFEAFLYGSTALCMIGSSGPVHAQGECGSGGSLRLCVESIDGRDGSANEFNLYNLPVSSAECAANVEVQFTIERIPTDRSVLDFWRSSGTACNETAPRSDATMEGCDHLDLSVDLEIRGPEKVLRIPVRELMGCAPDTTSTYTLFVLAANSATSTEDVGSAWTSMQVRLDTRPPLPPASVRAQNGEHAPSVSWVPSEEGLREHRIYVNTSGCDAAPVAGDAGLADAGAPAAGGASDEPLPAGCSPIPGEPTPPDGYRLVACESGTATRRVFDPEALGIPVGASFGVALTAVDQARNESPAATVCVQRIATQGFCDLHGGCPQDCSCSLPGRWRPEASDLFWALPLALLWWRRRSPGGNVP